MWRDRKIGQIYTLTAEMVPLGFRVIFQKFKSPRVAVTNWRLAWFLTLRQFLIRAGLVRKIMSTEPSAEIRHTAYTWSKDSIGGVWGKISEDQLIVKHLSGGLSNYLYLCSLPENIVTEDNVPRKVLLRVYGEIARKKTYLVRNTVVFALFSEKKLGPKLYGMYPEGRIEEFIPARPLRTSELPNPTFSRQIAKKLAYFHTLEMPLCKTPSFVEGQLEEWLVEVEKVLSKKIRRNVDQNCLQMLKRFNLRKEQQFILDTLSRIQSPIVFSHNDLQEGNILLNESETDPEKQLTVIDLEYCSYNYRGFDFGNHFCEWTLNYAEENFPNYVYTPEDFPTRERQNQFFTDYLTEKRRLEGSLAPITEEELSALYKEANTFVMVSHYVWAIWSIVQQEISDIQFGYLEYACERLEAYTEQKSRLIKDGLI